MPSIPGARNPTIPTRMNTTPMILQMVFAMTFVVPPWEEKVEGGRAPRVGLASPPASVTLRACGRNCTSQTVKRMYGFCLSSDVCERFAGVACLGEKFVLCYTRRSKRNSQRSALGSQLKLKGRVGARAARAELKAQHSRAGKPNAKSRPPKAIL